MVGRGGLTFGEDSLLRRVHDTSLGAFRGRELDRVRVHLSGSNDLSRIRIPRVRLRTLYGRTQLRVKVLHGVLDTPIGNPLDSPRDRAVRIRPAELHVLWVCVFIMGRVCTIIGALAGAFLVAPDKGLHSLTVQCDRTLSGANRAALKASTCPPSARNIRLVLVGLRNLSDLTGQLCLVGRTLTDDRPIIESERKTSVPDERCLALIRHCRDSELLADSQLVHGPGAADVDLGRGLSRRGRGLRDLSVDSLRILSNCRMDHTSDDNGPKAERCENALHDVPFKCVKAYNPCLGYR